MPLKHRARLVCVQCHERKIRCDLQGSRDSTCENCRRSGLTCIRRQGNRKSRVDHCRRHLGNAVDGNSSAPVAVLSTSMPWPEAASHLPDGESVTPNSECRSSDRTDNSAYIAEHSILGRLDCDSLPRFPEIQQGHDGAVDGAYHQQVDDWRIRILIASSADVLPKQPLREALFDAFFASRGHTFPFITRHDVEAPGASILLQQAVCLAGSLMRHPCLPDTFIRSQTFYEKIRLLLALNVESDMMAILKALCLLTIWCPTPSNISTLGGPWHATGTAIRLAMQLGMHRKNTYSNKTNSQDRRKLWWFLYSSECAQALVYGRPPMLKQADFDVPELEEADFGIMDTNSKIFITDVRIAHIMGEVASKLTNPSSTPLDQAYISNLLTDWVSQLAPDLSLYACDGSRAAYRFAISEIHIEYLATLIISQALYRHLDKRWPCSAACLVASTCMAKLYEEILCREDVAKISNLHAFLCLAAAVPLLYYKPVTLEKEKQRQDDLSVLYSVIDLQKPRYGLAQTVARKLNYLEIARRENLLHQTADSGPDAVSFDTIMNADDAAQLKALFPHLFTQSTVEGPMVDNMIARETMSAISSLIHEADMAGNIFTNPQPAVDALGASAFIDSLFDNFQFGGENGSMQQGL